MKKLLFIMGLSAMGSVSSFGQATCATAQVVMAGQVTIPTINGTEVPAPVCATGGGGATAANWYKYTPAQNYTVTVTTDFVANGSVDNRVHVYTGTCGGTYACIAGDDDSGSGYLCVVTFNVSAGTDYYIVFDNKWSSSGFMFELSETPVIGPNPNMVVFTPTNINSISGDYKLAVADMNGDYLDDIISVSSTNVQIHYQGANGTFSAVSYATTAAQYMPSWSMAIGDLNADGFNDLLYGGGSGVTFMQSNGLGTGYTQSSGPQYVFSQRSNFVDINNDGHLDAFVCHDVAPNVYYLNDGSGNLTFHQGGIGDHPNGGNYGSIWVDYNNDGLPDLFIAKCRGGQNTAKINELHRNNGDGTFTNVSVQAGLADSVQTWSSAWNDFDNDGWMDVIVGASSGSDGMHKFMRNNGDGTFTNITAGSGWDTYGGLSIEYVSYDFNNDGFADVFTNNTILFNNGNNTFTPHTFPMSSGAIGDLNNDGFLDVHNNNTVYWSSGNDNNWLTVTLRGVTSNRNGIGARVEIYGAWGKQIRDVRSGVGFRYMGTLNTHFGIGTATQIDSVVVRWPSGNVDVLCDNIAINTVLHVVESSAEVAAADFAADQTSILEGESVSFTDASAPCPNAWEWSVVPATGWVFDNGTDATSQNPVITFEEPGTYEVSLIAFNSNGTSATPDTETIVVSPIIGVKELETLAASVYPNPVDDMLYIRLSQSEIKSVRIVSMLGIELETALNRADATVSVAHLAPGTYFLSITTENDQVIGTRFVKK